MLPLSAAIALCSRSALADVEIAVSAPDQWVFEITHVPDFDQKRTALPGGGHSYCVPTTATNWMAYLANHGRPSIVPGPGHWQAHSMYSAASFSILNMGVLMGTGDGEGTAPGDAVDGLIGWLSGEPVIVFHAISDDDWSPTFEDVVSPVFLGGYVWVSVGWYLELSPTILWREGGHALAVTYGARSGDSKVIGWRDPGSDEDDHTMQSLFREERYAIENRWVRPAGDSNRWMSKVIGYENDVVHAYIDRLFTIIPGFVVTPQTDLPWFGMHHAVTFFGSPFPGSVDFGPLVGRRVLDVALLADYTGFVCVVEADDPDDPPTLQRVHAASGEAHVIDNAMLTWPARVMVGRRRDLYLLDHTKLVRLDIDTDPPERWDVDLPGAITTLSYDDATDTVMLLAVDTGRLFRYPHDLSGVPEEWIISASSGVPLTGRTSICWNGPLECIMLVCDDDDALWQLTKVIGAPIVLGRRIALPGLVSPTAVDVDDAGRVYVSTQGAILEVVYRPESDEWVVADDPHYAGLPAGERIAIARSRSNHDPAVHSGPAWHDVPPEVVFADPIYDCPPDLDGSRVVDFADLLAMLTAWGPCPIGAF